MSKTKKGRTADKLIDSVLTDLSEGDEQSPKEVSNPFLDALRETRSEVHDDESDVPFANPQENEKNENTEGPEGLLKKSSQTAEVVKHEATLVQKSEEPAKLVDAKPRVEESATMQIPEDKTEDVDSTKTASQSNTHLTDRTQPMAAGLRGIPDAPVKAAYGYNKPSGRDLASSSHYSDAQMVQAENLRLAQTRILELENEAEKLRQENELLTAAGTIAKTRLDELTEKIHALERSKIDAMEHAALEMKILKESLLERDRETAKAKRKVEELETRLNSDLKKIRVRERELENRLELSRLEKTALVRSKDENILDLKRKMDLISSELENYKQRTSELQDKIDNQHDQISRTVRALRLALTNLESSDTGSDAVLPLKKAE